MFRAVTGFVPLLLALALIVTPAPAAAEVRVMFETTMGNIELELYPATRPITVANFLQYVEEGFYDGDDGLGATIFHRVIPDFVIQGGGYTAELEQKATHDPIINENDLQHSNVYATLTMARTSEPDSATSQFFINMVDNSGTLDWTEENPGYCVFGHVLPECYDVIDAISLVDTDTHGGMSYVPDAPIVITNAYIVPEPGTVVLLILAANVLPRRR